MRASSAYMNILNALIKKLGDDQSLIAGRKQYSTRYTRTVPYIVHHGSKYVFINFVNGARSVGDTKFKCYYDYFSSGITA